MSTLIPGGIVPITYREVKGSPLTSLEVDGNFSWLANAAVGLADALDAKASITATDRAKHTGYDTPTLNEQFQAYTLQLTDALPQSTLRMTVATPTNVTIPAYATTPFPRLSRIPVDQWGTGSVTIVGAAGVTIRSAFSFQSRAQYSRIWLENQNVNEWLLSGDLAVSGAPVNTVPPTISGTAVAGQTLTRVSGTWIGTPSPTVTGLWFRNGVTTGTTTSTYATATPADANAVFTWVESAVSTAGGPNTQISNAITMTPVAATKPVSNGVLPAISGTPTVNSTLTVTSGGWTNSPTNYRYQWFRNGTTAIRDSGYIAGATDTYLLTSVDAGTTLTVTVTAQNGSGNADVSVTSAGAAISGALPVVSGSSFPAIYEATDTYTAGVTLTVDVGAWLNNPTFNYQWYRANPAVDGALTAIGTNSASYTTVTGDSDRIISCAVTATTTSGSTTVYALGVLISASSAAPVNSVAPVISGSTTIGSVLTATTGTWTNSPTFAYQWKRGATNVGTNSSTYTTVSADGGGVMTCVVTATASSLSASATSNSITMGTAGSGSLAITQTVNGAIANVNDIGTVDWAIWNNTVIASPAQRKSGGGTLITGANNNGTSSGGIGPFISVGWTGGTPTASGSAVDSCSSEWGATNSGHTLTFPIGTASSTVDVYVQFYNLQATVTASLSDSSAATVSSSIDTGSAASTSILRFRVIGNAAASGQTLTITILTAVTNAYGAGNFHTRAATINV